MRKFKDATGRIWRIELNDTIFADIEQRTGLNLRGVEVYGRDPEVWTNLAANTKQMLLVLYLCCLKQCQYYELTTETFAAALGADGIFEAYKALTLAHVDTLPSSQQEFFRDALIANQSN